MNFGRIKNCSAPRETLIPLQLFLFFFESLDVGGVLDG